MERHESQYQSYLLRLWRAGEEKAWRVMLEHISTRDRHGFADLEGLCVFLREQMKDKVQVPNVLVEDKERNSDERENV